MRVHVDGYKPRPGTNPLLAFSSSLFQVPLVSFYAEGYRVRGKSAVLVEVGLFTLSLSITFGPALINDFWDMPRLSSEQEPVDWAADYDDAMARSATRGKEDDDPTWKEIYDSIRLDKDENL